MKTFVDTTNRSDFILEDVLYAMQQRNLVYNSDFRYHSNQVHNGNVIEYDIPDGWMYTDPGKNGKINFDPATNQCVIVKSQDNSLMCFKQHLHEFPRWKEMLLGQCITAKVVLNISTASNVSVILTDGIDSNTITKKGSGDFEIETQLEINPEATLVSISIESDAAFVSIGISKVYANVGNMAIGSLPCIVEGVIGERRQYIATEHAPAEELSICEKAVELGEGYTRLDAVINQRFGTGPNKRSLLPDMRGYFSRAWDNASKIDPDAANRKAWGQGIVTGDHVSTLEEDEFLQHDHGLEFSTDKPILIGNLASANIVNTASTSKTKPIGGKETRPKNITELYTIKWA